ncbi:SIMPL domain-containing protein [Sphingomonas donggukensis]|uniref:SIMPL domain-containing protein n=1 Tax=Sphingomonas donggukensis TaxID=2949093 RepID=A0ABY4TSE1_9SPHN|nr:SIMPL domain-containing protein [Sphingomonas donggukensis]URW75314.1 SIMPL domain-containing protein [Sphingomonas donggukensis]
MIRHLTATALALAPFVTPLSAAAQVATVPPVMIDGTLLDVSATGVSTRTPDIATIRAGVVTQSATAAAALSANADRMAGVLAALKSAGVEARDIQTSTISLQPQYRYTEGQAPAITGYQASNTVSVRFRDIARSGRILDTLVKQGANQIEGPALSIDKADAATDEARVDAVAKARARAELYAKAAGLRVDRIVSIGESGDSFPQPPMPVMMMRAEKASADTAVAAGEQDVKVTIAVRFLLK